MAGAGLSIHRWLWCMPQRDLLVSPWSPKVMLPQSAVRPSHTPSSSSAVPAAAAAVVQFCSGRVESDSTRPDLLSWSQGNFPCRLPTSGFIGAEWREASGHPPFSLPPSLPPYLPASHSSLPPSPSAFSLYFCPLHFFSSSPSSSTIQYPCLILT